MIICRDVLSLHWGSLFWKIRISAQNSFSVVRLLLGSPLPPLLLPLMFPAPLGLLLLGEGAPLVRGELDPGLAAELLAESLAALCAVRLPTQTSVP